jgi:type II secretory pathway pseudopilin PulG
LESLERFLLQDYPIYPITRFLIIGFLMALHSQMRGWVHPGGKAKGSEDGYIMLTLLLAMALLVIFAAAIVPSITFDIRRDREQEMIHRGVQYSRAIRAYYKKFGRYPTRIEDLESANNQRFLRKRYKDPMNCKNLKCEDFKLLHFGEVQLTLSGIGGGSIPGANAIGTNGGLNGGPTGSGGFSQPTNLGGNSGFGANSNSSFGQNQQTTGGQPSGSDSPQSGSSSAPGPTNGDPADASTKVTLGGGPIVGVASTVKDKTIREFNHKNKYKDWVFVYDPAQDQGRLITTPYQPQVPGFGQQGMQNLNGQTGGTGFGTPASPSGTQNGATAPTTGGSATPNPPNNPPPQQ